MPVTKLGISFFTYKDGKLVNHTSGASTINEGEDIEAKAKEFLVKHFPEAGEMKKKTDDYFLDQGGWTIRGESKDNPNMAFVLVISKL